MNPPVSTSQNEAGIEVTVSGAVRRPGRHRIPSPATVAAALIAAGGMVQTRRMWPSGAMTIRRLQPEREEEVWKYDISKQPASEWGRFALQSGDVVTLQWHVENV
jgi:protein involved in polysaccharide export with SLBB domain